MALEPYVSHTAINRTTNLEYSIFAGIDNSFDPNIMLLATDGVGIANGVTGYITIGVDTATQKKMKREALGL